MSQSMQHTMAKNGVILAIFAIVTTGLIAMTFFGTKDQIALQQQQKLLSILNAVVDKDSFDNSIYLDCALMTSKALLGSDAPQHIYRATKQGKEVAVAIETTAPDGYSGKIHLVVGLTKTSENVVTVSGVRVLEHKETPGLGDKIDLRISDWILGFNQQTYHTDNDSIWAVKKDGGKYDQFTGATITPRAVVKAIKHSAEYYMANQAAIFNADNACSSDNSTSTLSVQEADASE